MWRRIWRVHRYIILVSIIMIIYAYIEPKSIKLLLKELSLLNKYMEVSMRIAARQNHLLTECEKSTQDKASPREFLINRPYHIIWCNVFKAASTSWLYNFNLMAHYPETFLNETKESPVTLARYRYPRPSLSALKQAQSDSLTFMIVRHPLERLASAYNDKIVHAKRKTEWFVLRLKIHQKYAKRKKGIVLNEKLPSFADFVSFVLDEAKSNRTLNEHWIPYSDFCTPCKIFFDVILKFETLNEDQNYLIHLANLDKIVKVEWRNKRDRDTNRKQLTRFYSTLSKLQLDGLYQLYKNDFKLFDYNMDKYYEILKKNKLSLSNSEIQIEKPPKTKLQSDNNWTAEMITDETVSYLDFD